MLDDRVPAIMLNDGTPLSLSNSSQLFSLAYGLASVFALIPSFLDSKHEILETIWASFN